MGRERERERTSSSFLRLLQKRTDEERERENTREDQSFVSFLFLLISGVYLETKEQRGTAEAWEGGRGKGWTWPLQSFKQNHSTKTACRVLRPSWLLSEWMDGRLSDSIDC